MKTPTTTRVLRAGTRGSRLARMQTALIGNILRATLGVHSTEIICATGGDQDQHTPLPSLGGRGVFTDSLERALLAEEIDYAVHSLKDVPVDLTPGLVLAAIGFREDPRDLLLSASRWTIETLPPAARVGTCSVRRSAQILAHRPDLTILPLRGNVDGRLDKLAAGAYDAIVLAAAGVNRLGLAGGRAVPLPLDAVTPAPGQGALAVQCRADDRQTLELLSRLDDPAIRAATDAERGFLEGLGGGCLAPIAAIAEVRGDALSLSGTVLTADGRRRVDVRTQGDVASGRACGLRLAEDAVRLGALELLA